MPTGVSRNGPLGFLEIFLDAFIPIPSSLAWREVDSALNDDGALNDISGLFDCLFTNYWFYRHNFRDYQAGCTGLIRAPGRRRRSLQLRCCRGRGSLSNLLSIWTAPWMLGQLPFGSFGCGTGALWIMLAVQPPARLWRPALPQCAATALSCALCRGYQRGSFATTSAEGDGATARLLRGPTRTLALLLPTVAGSTVPSTWEGAGLTRLYRLTDGTVEEMEAERLPEIALDQPSLVVVEN